MYPAILIAFKLGGGLEISLNASFSNDMSSIFQNEPALVSLLCIFGLLQIFRPFATHNLVYGGGVTCLEPDKIA